MLDIPARVRELRNEIIELKQANEFNRLKRGPEAVNERARREQRLVDIKEELSTLLKRLQPNS